MPQLLLGKSDQPLTQGVLVGLEVGFATWVIQWLMPRMQCARPGELAITVGAAFGLYTAWIESMDKGGMRTAPGRVVFGDVV